MQVQVVYYSRGGNTRRLAKAVAEGAGSTAQSIEEARISQPVDILFVGGAIYAGGLHKSLAQFLQELPAGQVKQIVTFSTSLKATSILPLVRPLLAESGIEVSGREYCCKGQFLLFNSKLPSDDDLRRARDFAAKIVRGEE